jgi:site-specific DNA recombinase
MPREKILRAAYYGRVSDEKQEKMYSPAFQKSKCLTYMREQNYAHKMEHEYFDTYTGRDWRNRKELQKLIEGAKRHEFDIVVMYRLDRFSRDLTGQIVVRDQLKFYGVTIVTLDPDEHADDDSPLGEVIRAVYGFQAEIQRKKVIEITQDGLKERVSQGKLLAGRKPLYGYHWNNDEEKAFYVLFEPERKVVERIFTLYKEGVPMRRIAHILTEEGIPTPDGKVYWRAMTIYNILTHPGYTGKAYAYVNRFEFVPGEGMKRTERPQEEWIEVKGNPIPAIIDQETFDLVQKKLKKNKEEAARNNKYPTETLCRCGIVLCGHCKRNMSVQRTGRPRVPYYRCNSVREGYKECLGPSITANILDSAMWKKAVEVIKDPAILHKKLLDPKKREFVPGNSKCRCQGWLYLQWRAPFPGHFAHFRILQFVIFSPMNAVFLAVFWLLEAEPDFSPIGELHDRN